MRAKQQSSAERWLAGVRGYAAQFPVVQPLEVLTERYVSGYDTLEQFERYVEQTLREESRSA